jgi:hypothetical protein
MRKHAVISPCGLYRYELIREWDTSLPVLVFVMLNPSRADASIDDHTVTKDIGFAKRNGFGSIRVYNLWAYRATNPKDLIASGWDEGPYNKDWLIYALTIPNSKVICAWGANARKRHEPLWFIRTADLLGTPLYALRVTADNVPCHPLMLPYSCEITPYGKAPNRLLRS